MRPLSIPVAKRPPTEAALLRRVGLHGLLNFIGQPVKMLVEIVVHMALGGLGSEIADQGRLSRIVAKFFD
jgi:hypothetical protein